ncbi:unnamed protein product [Allacma fusca]|uniref:Uncharacterized protein n=1 Tax=Allacma fusca TaxID=39272 RepID=A0A8J2LLV7_9HEXA|nr:unnamed protein product [Allacma fusca]
MMKVGSVLVLPNALQTYIMSYIKTITKKRLVFTISFGVKSYFDVCGGRDVFLKTGQASWLTVKGKPMAKEKIMPRDPPANLYNTASIPE